MLWKNKVGDSAEGEDSNTGHRSQKKCSKSKCLVRNRCTHADSKIKIHEENNQKAQGNNKRQQKNTNLEKIFGMQTRKENTRSANWKAV